MLPRMSSCHDREAKRELPTGEVKFEFYGKELIEKKVSLSGNSGRIYLPSDWVGHTVKIVKVD
jgi:hypothetical protein